MAAVIFTFCPLNILMTSMFCYLIYSLLCLFSHSEFSPVKSLRTHQKTEKSRPRFHHFLIYFVGTGMAHETTKKKALGIINSLLEGIGDLDQKMLMSVPDCTKCAIKLGNNWQLCLSLVYSLRAPNIKPSMSVDFLKNRLFFILINWRLHYHLFICLTLFLYMIKMV